MSTAMSPAAKVRLPHQSGRAGGRMPVSRSFRYAQTVPDNPNGTDTRKTSRQFTGPSSPPSASPANEPAIPAAWFRPRASPRWEAGKASVRIALESAINIAPPTPWQSRMAISQSSSPV